MLLANANAKRIPLVNKSVDMVFTSLPFKQEDVDGYYWNEHFCWMEELLRVTKKVAIVINSSTKLLGQVEVFPPDRILIWGKGVSQYSYRYNPIFVYQIPPYKANKYIWCDAFGVEAVTGRWKVHPYQEPLLLYKTIIEMFGDCQTVLDPFMGSGTTGEACALLGKDFIGIEINPRYIDVSKNRLMKNQRPIANGVNQLSIGYDD
jgi:hypothetical protein